MGTEESYLTATPFSPREIEDIAATFEKAFDFSLKKLERKGCKAYDEFCQLSQQQQELARDTEDELKRTKQALDDGKIGGEPRHYQTTIFEIAKKKNVIVNLGTGLGKTLIGILCIRHFASNYEQGKQTLFLVPSVALAIQQSMVLRANLPYTVQLSCYASNVTEKARQELSQCNIIVATHGAIHDLLIHYGDQFSMDRFNLLVIDECHYATGNHEYSRIMKNFYHRTPPENRPRVLGLTASPLLNVREKHSCGKLEGMLSQLETILDAQLLPLTELGLQTKLHKAAEEKNVSYQIFLPTGDNFPPISGVKVNSCRKKELEQLSQLYEDLGPYALSVYCKTLQKEVSQNIFEEETSAQFLCLHQYLHKVVTYCDVECRHCPRGGRNDKLLALEELLETQVETLGSIDTVGLVFVERRITALALCDYFRHRRQKLKIGHWRKASTARYALQTLEQQEDASLPSHFIPRAMKSSISREEDNPSQLLSIVDNSLEETKPSQLFPFDKNTSSMQYHGSFTKQFEDAEETGNSFTSSREFGINVEDQFTMDIRTDVEDQFEDADEDAWAVSTPNHISSLRSELQSLKIDSGDFSADPEQSQFMDADEEEGLSGEAYAVSSNGLCSEWDSNQRYIPQAPGQQDTFRLSREVVVCNSNIKKATNKFDIIDEYNRDDLYQHQAPNESNKIDSEKVGPTDEHNESIRCGALVRKSTHIFKTLNCNRKVVSEEERNLMQKEWLHQETKIKEVLSDLRRGEINVLFATSVVEEGVDVRACSFVAVFDGLKSTKGYIQMKGRARQQDAKFFVFCSDEQNQPLSLDSAQEIELRVRNYMSDRDSTTPTPYVPECIDEYKGESVCLELRAVENGRYEAPNGTVDLLTAKSLIYRYALSLPMDPVARSSKTTLRAHLPVFSSYQLILPSHLPKHVRLVSLPECFHGDRDKFREQVMALMACVRLHSYELLSDRLLPLTRSDLHTQMTDLIAKIKQQRVHLNTRYVLNDFSDNIGRLYVYTFHQKSIALDRALKVFKGEGHSLAVFSTHRMEVIPQIDFNHKEFGVVSCCLGKGFEIPCSAEQCDVLSEFFVLLMNSRWRRRRKDAFFQIRHVKETMLTVPLYFIGCLSQSGEVDWDFMKSLLAESKRSEEERTNAVRASSNNEGLSQPRLWAPLYDEFVLYVAYGPSGLNCSDIFPHEKDNVKTYQDYFKRCRNFDVAINSPLFDVQRLWILPYSYGSDTAMEKEKARRNDSSTGQSTRFEVCRELASVKLPKDACMEVPFANAAIMLLSTYLPQFLHHMETCLTAKSFIFHCDSNLPQLGQYLQRMHLMKVVQALTAKSCNEERSYERLEWLGDAVLKLVQTDSLLESTDLRQWIKYLHEGDLSFLRSDMGCNDRLKKVCKDLKIDKFILISPLRRGVWVPCGLELFSPKTGAKSPTGTATGKICADVIEALLGLVYIKGGYGTALKIADELQLTLPREQLPVDDETKQSNIKTKPLLLDAVKAFTGHNCFPQYELVEQALTHPTALHQEVPSYQRLEWIGDAVLCLAARQWIFNQFPDAEVGDMVEKEAVVVANETLAFLSVKHNLQHHIDHCDQTLPAKFEDYVESVHDQGRGLWGTDPPKVLADVVEAIIGAVYLNSGFDAGIKATEHILSPILNVLYHTHATGSHLDLAHPKSTMKQLGGRLLSVVLSREEYFAKKKPTTPVWFGHRWGLADEGGHRFVASIDCMGTTLISTAEKSAEVARNRACAFAVACLRKNPSLLTRLLQCREMIDKSNIERKQEGKA